MNGILKCALIVALSTLAGCGQSNDHETTKADNASAVGNPPPSGQETALVGRWALYSRCTDPIVLAADGSFTTPEGDRGQWSLSGDRITLSGPASTRSLRAVSIEANTFIATYDDGAQERMVRC